MPPSSGELVAAVVLPLGGWLVVGVGFNPTNTIIAYVSLVIDK